MGHGSPAQRDAGRLPADAHHPARPRRPDGRRDLRARGPRRRLRGRRPVRVPVLGSAAGHHRWRRIAASTRWPSSSRRRQLTAVVSAAAVWRPDRRSFRPMVCQTAVIAGSGSRHQNRRPIPAQPHRQDGAFRATTVAPRAHDGRGVDDLVHPVAADLVRTGSGSGRSRASW